MQKHRVDTLRRRKIDRHVIIVYTVRDEEGEGKLSGYVSLTLVSPFLCFFKPMYGDVFYFEWKILPQAILSGMDSVHEADQIKSEDDFPFRVLLPVSPSSHPQSTVYFIIWRFS